MYRVRVCSTGPPLYRGGPVRTVRLEAVVEEGKNLQAPKMKARAFILGFAYPRKGAISPGPASPYGKAQESPTKILTATAPRYHESETWYPTSCCTLPRANVVPDQELPQSPRQQKWGAGRRASVALRRGSLGAHTIIDRGGAHRGNRADARPRRRRPGGPRASSRVTMCSTSPTAASRAMLGI